MTSIEIDTRYLEGCLSISDSTLDLILRSRAGKVVWKIYILSVHQEGLVAIHILIGTGPRSFFAAAHLFFVFDTVGDILVAEWVGRLAVVRWRCRVRRGERLGEVRY